MVETPVYLAAEDEDFVVGPMMLQMLKYTLTNASSASGNRNDSHIDVYCVGY